MLTAGVPVLVVAADNMGVSNKMDWKTSARYVGLGVVVSTHVYMLNAVLPEVFIMKQHAYANLAAVGLILWSMS
jgi:hypothetical protein